MFGDGFVEFAKAAKAVPQTLLFSGGIYGGQFAEKFPVRYVDGAAILCLSAAFIGGLLLVIVAVAATIQIVRQG